MLSESVFDYYYRNNALSMYGVEIYANTVHCGCPENICEYTVLWLSGVYVSPLVGGMLFGLSGLLLLVVLYPIVEKVCQ